MAAGKWDGRASAQRLANEWGVAVRTVQDYSRIASRLVWAASDDDRAELVADTIAKLTSLARKADEAGDWGIARACLDTRADVAGLKAPTRSLIDARVTAVTAPDTSGWTDEEIGRWSRTGEEPRRLGVGERDSEEPEGEE